MQSAKSPRWLNMDMPRPKTSVSRAAPSPAADRSATIANPSINPMTRCYYVMRTVSGGGQVGDDGEAHEVRQAKVRNDAVAAAGAEGPVPRAVVPVEVRHVLDHRHARHLRAVVLGIGG